MSKAEEYSTLCFRTIKTAEKNQREIKEYFGVRVVSSDVRHGEDERGKFGYYVYYILTPNH